MVWEGFPSNGSFGRLEGIPSDGSFGRGIPSEAVNAAFNRDGDLARGRWKLPTERRRLGPPTCKLVQQEIYVDPLDDNTWNVHNEYTIKDLCSVAHVTAFAAGLFSGNFQPLKSLDVGHENPTKKRKWLHHVPVPNLNQFHVEEVESLEGESAKRQGEADM